MTDSGPRMHRTATISDCGIYRYDLTRDWVEGGRILWIMLNPSTADASIDDPTIRRCIGFTKSWGFGGCTVVNLFALRSTDPRVLKSHPSPDGPLNAEYINMWAARCEFGVAAWGAFDVGQSKPADVATAFRLAHTPLFCLGQTKNGSPRHPLYVKGDAERLPFDPSGVVR